MKTIFVGMVWVCACPLANEAPCCDSQSQCQELRKRKQLELQILSESIQRWEGEDIKTMGNIIYMSQVMVQCAGSEVSAVAKDIVSKYPLAHEISDARQQLLSLQVSKLLTNNFTWRRAVQWDCACLWSQAPSKLSFRPLVTHFSSKRSISVSYSTLISLFPPCDLL